MNIFDPYSALLFMNMHLLSDNSTLYSFISTYIAPPFVYSSSPSPSNITPSMSIELSSPVGSARIALPLNSYYSYKNIPSLRIILDYLQEFILIILEISLQFYLLIF